jgi:streptomycin 6-kinase
MIKLNFTKKLMAISCVSWALASDPSSMDISTDSSIHAPDHLTQLIMKYHPESGQEWLDSIPSKIDNLKSMWNLKDLSIVDDVYSSNLLLKGFQNDNPIILKLIFKPKRFKNTKNALSFFNGQSTIQLLDHDDANQAFLMSNLNPGTPLPFDLNGINDVDVVCNIIKKIHNIPLDNLNDKESFYNISEIMDDLKDEDIQFNPDHVNHAKEIAAHLLATQPKEILLHGELHHLHILNNGDDWMAIDPDGLIGEPAFELGSFIRNPITGDNAYPDNLASVLSTRINRFASALDLPADRIAGWAYVQAVMGGVYLNRRGIDGNPFMHRADLLLKIMNDMKQ